MAERMLAGEELPRAEASAVLNCPDEKLPVLADHQILEQSARAWARVA
jgi:hypothetical protein